MENLGIDPKLLVAQLINFTLFFFVFRRFLSKPFSNFIKEEKQKDEDREKIYAKAKAMEEKLAAKEKEMKQAWKKEEEKIISEAKKTAEHLKADILDEAHEEAKLVKEQAKKQLQAEHDELLKEAKERVAKLGLYVVNNALRETLTDDVRKKITDKILKGQSKEINLYEN